MIRNMRTGRTSGNGRSDDRRHRAEVIAFAASARLPACTVKPNFVRDGGLVRYGPLLLEHYVMAAGYVDRILKGAKPADLPVEQPTRFELFINLKTAEALGLTIPQSLSVRAEMI
jgi:putative ABC transport system substrate-binding protein